MFSILRQVENQVMGKFELEYIFIEGKAKRVLFYPNFM